MNKKSVLWSLASLVVMTAMLLSACGTPATTAAPATAAPATVAPATAAPATAAPATAAPATVAPTATQVAALPNCGTAPVVMNAYFETGFQIPFSLTEEFTKQFPNVTWDIKSDQFANLITTTPQLLSSDNPPDLLRLPTMVSFAKDGLLMNLDSYATAFGWDKWPVPQLNQNRVAADGTRGSGSLYAMGLNYSLTGIFYNKKLAAQIGMTEPPKTVAEFEDLLAKAKAAGLQPIMNGVAPRAAWGSPSRSRT
jgi:raffinose/stachyose/melibiose transport system substrate-binding protein